MHKDIPFFLGMLMYDIQEFQTKKSKIKLKHNGSVI